MPTQPPSPAPPAQAAPARAGSPWMLAALVLCFLAVAATILIRGSGPLLPGGNMSSSGNHPLWTLPGWLALASIALLLLAPPAVVACALIAYQQRKDRPLPGWAIWLGCVFLVFFAVLCFV